VSLGLWKVYTRSGHFDNDLPVGKYSPTRLEKLLNGTGPNVETGSYPMAYEGVLSKIRRLYLSKSVETLKPRIRTAVQDSATVRACPACGGSRLNAAARACTLNQRSIADCHDMQVSDLASWIAALKLGGTSLLQGQLVAILADLHRVGLSYLSLSRPTGTLSGGEAQRIRTVAHLDSALTELTYVFDEPAAGLHPHDTARVIELLQELRDKGNSVLVVEHNPDVIGAADHIIELGPRAGVHGGQIVHQGDSAGAKRAHDMVALGIATLAIVARPVRRHDHRVRQNPAAADSDPAANYRASARSDALSPPGAVPASATSTAARRTSKPDADEMIKGAPRATPSPRGCPQAIPLRYPARLPPPSRAAAIWHLVGATRLVHAEIDLNRLISKADDPHEPVRGVGPVG